MEKTQEEQRVWLIEKLKAENPVYRKIPTPEDEQGQKDLLRSLMNVRPAKPVSEEFLGIQDAYLRRENMLRGIVDVSSIPACESDPKISIWQGDKKDPFSDEEMKWVESAVKRVKSNFVSMDLARREDGRLIIMELGDGQVSGLQQIKPNDFYRSFNPDVLSLGDEPIEGAFPKGAVILAGDPLPDVGAEEMRQTVSSITTTQELVDVYVHNKFWFIEDDLYDYDEGTDEYEKVRAVVDAWGDMMDELDKRIMETAAREGLLAERQPDSGTVKQLEAFMDKYGYRNGCGWWVKR